MTSNRPHSLFSRGVRVAAFLRKAPGICLFVLALIFALSGASWAQSSVPLVTVATDQSPLNLSNQFGVPAGATINQNGDFAFVGHGDTALFFRLAGATSATRVLQIGDAVPGITGSRIGSFSPTVGLNASKVLLFDVRFNITGDDEFHSELLTYDGANFKTLVTSDDPAPGGSTTYGALQIGGINDHGDVSFSTLSVTPTNAGTITEVITYYILPAGVATAVRVAGTNDTPPAACTWCVPPPSNAIVIPFSTPPINAAGQILISFDQGLFIGSASGPLAVVPLAGGGPCGPSGTPSTGSSGFLPGGPIGIAVISPIQAFLNDTGAVAFMHMTFSGTSTTNAICVAPAGGAPPFAAVTSASPAPSNIGGTVDSPFAVAFNNSGDVAFQSFISGSTVTGFALLRHRQSTGQTDVVAYWGETAPGTNGLTFSDLPGTGPTINGVDTGEFSGISIANTGSVSFRATLPNNQSGVYRQLPGNPPELIFLGQRQPAVFYITSPLFSSPVVATKILDNGSTYFSTYSTGGAADFAEYLGTPGNLQTLMSTADGLPAGARTFLLSAPPKASGHFVAFTAEPAGGRLNLLLADISSTPPAITRVVSDNDPALATAGGTPGDTSISSNFFVNDSGQVAFEAAETITSPLISILQFGSPVNSAWLDHTIACGAIFLWSPLGGIAKVATTADTAPGSTAKFPCVALNTKAPSPLNQAGQVAFSSIALGWISTCTLSGCSPPSPNGPDGVFLYSPGGTTSDVASAGDTLPGETQSMAFVPFLSVPVNSAGQVAFGASLGTLAAQGFFIRKPGGATQNVMAYGDAVPGSTATFGFPHFISGLTNDGNLAFSAATSSAADGLFFAPAGAAIRTIALDGGAAPGGGAFSLVPQTASGTGTTISGTARSFAAVNNKSDVAFGAAIAGGSADSGYFRQLHGGTLQAVVLQGHPVPGGGTFNTIPVFSNLGANFALGPDGAFAFVNTFTVGSVLRQGLFVASPDGTLVRVLATGDTLPVGGVATFLSLADRFAAGDPGQFAFLARIEDGDFEDGPAREAIFVTAIPAGTTSATVALNPLQGLVVASQSVTLTATVSATSGNPSGTITFFSNGVSLGTKMLSSGQATLTTSSLLAGQDAIVAQYGGDLSFAAANSPAVQEVVVGFAPPPSTLTVPRGQSLVIPLTLYAPPGSNVSLTLSCSGLPAGTNCSFDRNPVTWDPGSTSTTVQLKLSTMGSSKLPVRPPTAPLPPVGFGLSALLAALAAVLMALLWRRAPGLRLAACACLALSALALVMAGCGAVGSNSNSNGSPVTPLGPASFTVTGTSGATTISTVVNVTVQ